MVAFFERYISLGILFIENYISAHDDYNIIIIIIDYYFPLWYSN